MHTLAGVHIFAWRYIMIEFITGASGTGKTTEMFRRIRSAAELGTEQCILVPEQYSYEFDKNLYGFLGPKQFNELFSLSFSSLARQLFQLYGDPDRKGEYADDMARMILVYQAIEAAAKKPEMLRYFRRISSQPGFAEEMLKLISDMKRAGITPDMLSDHAELLDSRLRDKTADIASVYSEYLRLMEEYGFKDSYENIRFAAKIANMHGYFRGRRVYLDEFESFTGDQLEMLGVIFSSAENVVITLRTDDVSAGEFTLFETVNSTFRRLVGLCRELHLQYKVTHLTETHRFASTDLCYLSENVMRSRQPDAKKAPHAQNIRIFEARDVYSEIEYICAEIKRLVASTEGLRYRDIAIISNDITGYADLLRAAFTRYEIPYFLSIERPVSHTAVMAFFISLLDLLPARKLRSEQVFRLLKCGILDIELTDVSLLENYCYKWSVDGDVWLSEFTAEDEQLANLEAIRKQVIEPIAKLKKQLSRKQSAASICRKLYDYLTVCEAERNLAVIMGRLIRNDRDCEAGELKRLWKCLMDILDSIVSTLGDEEVSFSRLADIMRSLIARITYSVPPQTLDAVIAASSRTARLNSPKVIFAAGSTEGDFPNQVTLGGLFSGSDRQKLSDRGIEIARPLSDLRASERLIVYKSLSTASEKLYLTYPLSDLSGQAKYPSQVIDQISKMFPDTLLLTENDLTPEHYAVTYHAAYYHYMQNRADNSPVIASIREVLLADPVYRSRMISVLDRTASRTERTIASETMRKLKSFEPLSLSPTQLETYNNCHFMHFCRNFLRLQIPEKMELDVRVTGEMTHNCFYSLLSSRKKSDFIKLTVDELQSEIRSEAERYKTEKLAGDFAKTPRFKLLFNKLEERLTQVFVHTQQALMQSDFVPVRFEYDMRGDKSLRLPFGDGMELRFGGIADRIDTCELGGGKYLRVIDYKSSDKSIDAFSLAGGLNLQMLLYIFAATEKGSEFEGYSPAGVLYTPIQLDELKADEAKSDTFNQAAVDSELRTSGLVIDDMNVANAMEHDLKGRFIPAKKTANNVFDSHSSVIPAANMGRLRENVYSSLTEAAESMLSGKIEAVPLKNGKKVPCKYCDYADICGNRDGAVNRLPDAEKLAEAEDILGKNKKGGSEDALDK